MPQKEGEGAQDPPLQGSQHLPAPVTIQVSLLKSAPVSHPPQPTCRRGSGLRPRRPGRGPHSSALSPAWGGVGELHFPPLRPLSSRLLQSTSLPGSP